MRAFIVDDEPGICQRLQRELQKEGCELEIETAIEEQYAQNLERLVEERTKELRESEARYRLLMETADDAIFVLGADLCVIEVNPYAEQAIGYARDELIGRPFPELGVLTPASLGLAAKNTARVLAGERVSGAVYEFITKDGQHLLGEVSGAPIYYEGQVVGVLAIARDITERKLAEEALRESEEKHRTLIDNIQDGVFIIQDVEIQFGNEAFARMAGYTVEEITGMDFRQLVAPEDLEMVADRYRRRQAGEDVPREYELRLLHKDGKTRVFVNMNVGLIDYRGRVASMGTGKDITERKRAEEEIKQRVARLAAINRVSAAISSTLDSNEIFGAITQQMVELFAVEHSGILMFDEKQEWGHILAEYPDRGATAERFEVKGYLAAERIIADQKPLMIEDTLKDPLMAKVRDTMRRLGIKSMLIVPLVVKGETIGSIGLDAIQERRVFNQEEIELSQTIANQVATAIENARLYTQTQQRAGRLALLNQVITVASSTLKPKAVLETICRELALAFDVPQAAATLLNEARTASIVVAEYLAEGRPSGMGVVIPVEGNPITQYVVEHQAPLAVADAQHDPRMAAIHELMRQRGTVSLLILPLMVRGRVVGTLGLDAVERREFSDEEITLAASAAAAAAQALENARLFEAEHQARQISDTLSEIARELNAAPDLNAALDLVLSCMERVIAFDSSSILLLENGQMSVAAVRGFEEPERVLDTHLCLDTALLNKEVVETRRPLIVASTSDDLRWVKSMAASGLTLDLANIHSWMGVPLLVQERVIGMLTADKEEPNFYRPEDAELALAFAGHAAVAIENARLYEAAQQELTERKRTEATLRQSEEKYRTLIDSMQDGVFVIQGVEMQFVNEAFARMAGYTVEEITGMDFRQLVAPEDLEMVADRYRRRQAGEDVPREYEFRMLHKDGKTRVFVNMNVGLIDYRGKIASMGTVKDITERKRAEAALQQRVAELSALFEVSGALRGATTVEKMLPIVLEKTVEVLRADTGAIFRVDERTEELVAWAARGRLESLLGLRLGPIDGVCGYVVQTCAPYPFADLAADPHTGERVKPLVEGVLGGVCVPLFTGERLVGPLIIGSYSPRTFTEGEVRLLTAIADMAASAIHRAGLFEQLEHRVHELAALFDMGKMVTATLHIEDVLEFVAGAAAQTLHAEASYLFLWDEREARLVLRASQGFYAEEDVGRIKRRQDEGLAGWVFLEGKIANVPDTAVDPRWKRKSEYEAALASKVARNALVVPLIVGVKTLGVLGVVNKIGAPVSSTALRASFTEDDQSLLTSLAGQVAIAIENARLYESLQAANRELQAALRAQDEMIQNVSHELRTPLTTISGYVELLGEAGLGPLTAEQAQALEVMRRQVRQLYFMVNRFLTLQTIDAGGLQKIEVEPGLLLCQAVEARQARAAVTGIRVDLEVSADVPQLEVDVDLMNQVLDNLLDNAVKFSPNGGVVRVRARLEQSASLQERQVLISIADPGIGIPPDKLAQMFERFYQADGSTTRRFGGAGIGLALCRKIVEAHGGRIWAESEGEGRGSTFYVALPGSAPESVIMRGHTVKT